MRTRPAANSGLSGFFIGLFSNSFPEWRGLVSPCVTGFLIEGSMQPEQIFQRYQELQRYVSWSADDAQRVKDARALVEPHFEELVDDFYHEINQHPNARKVITGGEEQIVRLKQTLRAWLAELFSGKYDEQYVARRWQVGYRHVEIGLDQVYTNVALSRLRRGMLSIINRHEQAPIAARSDMRQSLNVLLDLDLAIIEDAYQVEYRRRQKQTEQLATIGQVAGGIAHELRNPLNVVKTSVYYLLNSRSAPPEKVQTHLERINRQVGLADGVITALNSFAKLPVPAVEPVEVEPFLREVLESTSVPSNIEVSVVVQLETPHLLADAAQLRIALSNLVRNARDAMKDGGQLTLSADADGDCVKLEVADTGTGIEPALLSRIMEPLFTTKARGIGLGLAISRAIVEKHNGRIAVASQVNQGTVFTVYIPAMDSA